MLLKGKLHLAPLDNPQEVLDLGTGTGIWAIDFGMLPPETPLSFQSKGQPASSNSTPDIQHTNIPPPK